MRRELNERLPPGVAAEASDGYRCRPLSAAPPARSGHWIALQCQLRCREIGKEWAKGRISGWKRHPSQKIQRNTRPEREMPRRKTFHCIAKRGAVYFAFQKHHSFKIFSRLDRLIIMNLVILILFVATLFALLLVCGVFWGLYFALSRSYQVFSAGELAKIARTIVANLEVPMGNISLVCLALLGLSVAYYPDKGGWHFFSMIASLLLIIGSLMITTAIEVPINRQVVTLTDEKMPENWEQLRGRWQYYNVVRTMLPLLSFLLFAAAIVLS
jgi:uncharacterized membrane protein